MSYDGNYIRFDPRFRQITTSAETYNPTVFAIGNKIKRRFRQAGDFAIRSTKRFRDVSDFVVSDNDFAMWMGVLGLGVGSAGLVIGAYLGDKYGFFKEVTEPLKILTKLFGKK